MAQGAFAVCLLMMESVRMSPGGKKEALSRLSQGVQEGRKAPPRKINVNCVLMRVNPLERCSPQELTEGVVDELAGDLHEVDDLGAGQVGAGGVQLGELRR